jgi:hypothetical protein
MGAGITAAVVEKASNSGSDAGLGLGIVALGVLVTTVGVVIWVTAPKPQNTAAVGPSWDVGLTFGGATARGTF